MKYGNRHLLILFLKHLSQRRRRPFNTLWEIISGALIFCIIFLVRQTTFSKSPFSFKGDIDIQRLLYAPDYPWTYNMISSFALKLDLKQGNKKIANTTVQNIMGLIVAYSYSLTSSGHLIVGGVFRQLRWNGNDYFNIYTHNDTGYFGFDTIQDIYKFIATTNRSLTTAVIIFNNERTLPKNLSYDIFLDNMNEVTLKLHDRFEIPKLMNNPVLNYDRTTVAIKLQWLVDKAFLDLLTDVNFEHYMDPIATAPMTKISEDLEQIHHFLIICTVLAPLPFFLYTTAKLVEEKRSSLKELVKLVGVTPNTIRFAHLLDTLLIATIYSIIVTILLKVTSKPILPNTSSLIVFITIIFHFLNISCLAFISSTLSQDYQHSDGVSLLVYLLTYALDNLWYNHNIHNTAQIYVISWLLPHAPVYLFWNEVTALEKTGLGSTFANIWEKHSAMYTPIVMVWVFFALQLVVILTLAWYVDLVRPGQYGVAKNWNFIFKRKFWTYKKKSKRKIVSFHVTVEQVNQLLRDDRYFEKLENEAEIAVKIVQLKKTFTSGKRQVEALKQVNLDIYKGEITVLLGPNGSGKSTLFDIVTGMYSATAGIVYINGMDTATRLEQIRKDLGFCPQRNITFEHLTVKENIIFFELLKGSSRAEANINAHRLMTDLQIDEKADFFSYQLSAGRKRCLQVACALAGEADVLVLDEPTSGMDVESKHSFWDMLLLLRGGKTILMSTTCIEEADALGDRIAILSEGKLRCHGSATFLKDAIGVGVNLTVLFSKKAYPKKIEPFFKDIEHVKVKVIDTKRVTLTLPVSEHPRFSKIFDEMEMNRKDLGINSMSVDTPMEEVFMSFIQEDEPEQVTMISDSDKPIVFLKGYELYMQQFLILTKRNINFLCTKKIQFLVMQVLVPIIGIAFVTLTLNSNLLAPDDDIADTTSSQHVSPVNIVLHNFHNFNKNTLRILTKNRFPNTSFIFTEDVPKGLMRMAQENSAGEVLGIQLTDNSTTKLFYPINARITARAGVNMLTNIILAIHHPLDEYRVMVKGLNDDVALNKSVVFPKRMLHSYSWMLYVSFLIILPMVPLIWTAVHELHTGTRYSHILAGCPPILHWLSKFMTDMMIYLVIILPTVLLSCRFLDFDRTFIHARFLVAVAISLVIYGAAFLVHMYVLSFILSHSHATSQIYIIVMSIGIVFRVFVDFLFVHGYLIDWLLYISPIHIFSALLFRITWLARFNTFCDSNRHLCPNLKVDGFPGELCCESEPGTSLFSYYSLKYGVLIKMLVLLCHFVVYSVILIQLQNKNLLDLLEYVSNYWYRKPEPHYHDVYVTREKKNAHELVDKLKSKEHSVESEDEYILIAKGLYKNYTGLAAGTKRCNAVKGISFALKKGEAIALVGAAGAGKTSTINMIAGYTTITRGDSYVKGYCIHEKKSEYLSSIAVSPQTGGLDVYLSGYDFLVFIAKLHGYPPSDANHEALFWIHYMGLSRQGSALVDTYSAGCSRRLVTAAALITNRHVTLLDEPIESVDHSTRPLVTRALRRALERNSAVVIATQNLDWKEIDTLCDHIAVLSSGELAAMGTGSQIRSLHTSGFTVRLKVRVDRVEKQMPVDDPSDSESRYSLRSFVYLSNIVKLKQAFYENFPNSILVEEHLRILHYHIRESLTESKMLLSEMFRRLEGLKENLGDVLEDYVLSEITLQDIIYDFSRREHAV